MSLPSTVRLIKDLTSRSGKVRLLGSVLAYDVQNGHVTLEADGYSVAVDVSTLLTTSSEGHQVSLKINIGEVVHVMGYVEVQESQALIIRAIMYWGAGRMTGSDKSAYADIVRARNGPS